ncbi:MAG: FAD-dependent oxidoreductase [Desulfarculaceae bacterium]|nr:FAD-dependent oxidoreductase [Desulfarculaceae bacterium]
MDKSQTFDTVVAGAGVAGICACLVAAERNMSVALVEKEPGIGGAARDCFHTHMAGLFQSRPEMPFAPANPGVSLEIHQHLLSTLGNECLTRMGRVSVMAFDSSSLWRYFEDRLEKSGVSFFPDSEITGMGTGKKGICSVQTWTKRKPGETLTAKTFIDATGNAVLSRMFSTGAAILEEADLQLSGYCIEVAGDFQEDITLKIPYTARKIVDRNGMNPYLAFVTTSCNAFSKTRVIKFSLLEERETADCEMIFEQLRQEIPSLGAATVLRRSKRIHPRGAVLPKGRAVLDRPSGNQGCPARSFWPSEFWDVKKGPRYRYLDAETCYCIRPDHVTSAVADNLFFCGKSISATPAVQASVRVMGVCMATGELAAQCAAESVREQNRT